MEMMGQNWECCRLKLDLQLTTFETILSSNQILYLVNLYIRGSMIYEDCYWTFKINVTIRACSILICRIPKDKFGGQEAFLILLHSGQWEIAEHKTTVIISEQKLVLKLAELFKAEKKKPGGGQRESLVWWAWDRPVHAQTEENNH